MDIEKALEILKKEGALPQEEYRSINSDSECPNEGAPCGACGAC